jgi:hypothetical protein
VKAQKREKVAFQQGSPHLGFKPQSYGMTIQFGNVTAKTCKTLKRLKTAKLEGKMSRARVFRVDLRTAFWLAIYFVLDGCGDDPAAEQDKLFFSGGRHGVQNHSGSVGIRR